MHKMFEKNVADYAGYRPHYPDDLVSSLTSDLEITDCCRILDLACGTGNLGRSILKKLKPDIYGADKSSVLLKYNNAESRVNAVAEYLPFKQGVFDSVLIAQAFHWFDFTKALAEINYLLKPEGSLAIVWYQRSRPLDGHRLEMDKLLRRINPNHKIVFMDYNWPDIIKKHGGFANCHSFETECVIEYPIDHYLKLQKSKSYIGDALDSTQLENFMRQYERILESYFPSGIAEERLQYFYVSARKI